MSESGVEDYEEVEDEYLISHSSSEDNFDENFFLIISTTKSKDFFVKIQ